MTDNILLADLLLPHIDKEPEYYENLYPNRNLPEGARVVRVAPSPTGYLHLGTLFASLVNRITATSSGGVFFTRIEDTDKKREIEGGIENIIDGLNRFGIEIDEGFFSGTEQKGDYGPYQQSQRAEIYQTYVKKLIKEGLAYPCFCTAEELEEVRKIQENKKIRTGYHGEWAKHRNITFEEAKALVDEGKPFVIRLKSPGSEENKVIFDDAIKGKIEMPENDEDFVLLKSDGIPTYHFAHAIDDHLMHTTHVIRGDEWVPSIPKHVQLFNVLGFELPKYCHHAAVTKKDEETGTIRKLSKRKDPEAAVSYYDNVGIPIPAVKLYLATILNSNFEEWYLNNSDKSIEDFEFTFEKMAIGGTAFDIEKLNNISKTYFSRKSGVEVYNETLAWAKTHDEDYAKVLEDNKDEMIAFLSIEKDGPRPRKDISKYSEVKEEFSYAIDEFFEKENYAKLDTDKEYDVDLVLDYVNNYLELDCTNEEWFNKVKEFALENGYAASPKDYKKDPESFKGHVGDICEAIRVMVTGRRQSPDLFSIMKILGKDRILKRVELYKNR